MKINFLLLPERKSFFLFLMLTLFSCVSSFALNAQETLFPENVKRTEKFSFNIDYKKSSSELCFIGAKYDTDKSSQRSNLSQNRHSHPYTLFYHSIFKNQREAPLAIAELGILYGSSLLMWQEYFTNATIYGFENNLDLIHSFQNKNNNDRITLTPLDVKNKTSIIDAFESVGVQYDLIIDDTTHQFEDQLRIIQNCYSYLKPGGMLIIEDIFKSFSEEKLKDLSRDLDLSIEFEKFVQAYHYATMQPYSFLYISTKTDELRKNFNEKIEFDTI